MCDVDKRVLEGSFQKSCMALKRAVRVQDGFFEKSSVVAVRFGVGHVVRDDVYIFSKLKIYVPRMWFGFFNETY